MDKTGGQRVIYLISGRSAVSWNIGRKILSVVQAFKQHAQVELVCGGDIAGGKGYNNEEHKIQSVADYHSKWYRKNALVNFFVRSLSELKDMLHCRQTYKLLKHTNYLPELIWERSSRLHWAGIKYAKKHNIPCVLEWKDNLIAYKYSVFHSFALRMERWKNRNADFIAVESQVLKEQLVQEGVAPDKIYVTYNAVNPEEFFKDQEQRKLIRQKFGFTEKDVVVGYVGSYAFYHDSIRMLKAAHILQKRGAGNIKWLLIGDGKDKAECEQYAEENGLLGKSVFMLPFQANEKIPAFLSAMDITVLPGSTDIICPVKVMEYMAAKSVVLVPDYKCNREIIDGTNGLLFRPFEEDSMAEVLLRVSGDPGLCIQLGENARNTIMERLTWDKTYGAVLQAILEKIRNEEDNS